MENQSLTTHQTSHLSICTLEEHVFQLLNLFYMLYYLLNLFPLMVLVQQISIVNVNVPIMLEKSTICIKHRIAKHVLDHRFSSTMMVFTTNMFSVNIQRDMQEALIVLEWKQVVLEEMRALENNET